MKSAIILHGMPSKDEYFDPKSPAQSNKHWLPWIQRHLILRGILAQTPEMPDAYAPNYEKWRTLFEQFAIDEETMLIGHSCGAGFLVRWLSENKTKVGKVALVAPWLNLDHEYDIDFFDFEIDESLAERTDGVTIFVSSDDYQTIIDSVAKIRSTVKSAGVKKFTDQGHFTFNDMKTVEFPELLDTLIR
ncbi:MAG: hypothetical protein HGA38_01195 [Candidatus Moranbacteria bacterium]|nr:hypothetical protein [Candidatus Moranbacteria bacterium]NTW45624.1 hypothetical protein [Candidatus Moranbacteria bacterium]